MFVDNSKKKSLQDRGMITRFPNKSKVFFSVRNVCCSYTKAILSSSRPLQERRNLGQISDIISRLGVEREEKCWQLLNLTYSFHYVFAPLKTLR